VTLAPQPPSPEPILPTSLESLLRHHADALEAILRTDDLAPTNERWSPFLPFLSWLISSVAPALTVDLSFEVDPTFHALWRSAQPADSSSRCIAVLLARAGQPDQDRTALVREFNDLIAASAIRSDGALEGAVEHEGGADAPISEGFPPVNLLHVGLSGDPTQQPQYLQKWIDRLAPGGVLVIPNTQPAAPVFSMLHRYIGDRLPTTIVEIGQTADVLVAQLPVGDAAPLVDHLRSAPPAFRGLFALFAERSEFRHLLGPDPASPWAVRAVLEELAESRRVERETFEVALRASRETMATLATEAGMLRAELLETKAQASDEKATMQNEFFGRLDEISAKLSTSAAHYNREIALRDVALEARERQAEVLAGEAAEAQRKVAELLNTSSWRMTAPVRLLSRLMGSGRGRSTSPPRG
jgi:hypothetical protein